VSLKKKDKVAKDKKKTLKRLWISNPPTIFMCELFLVYLAQLHAWLFYIFFRKVEWIWTHKLNLGIYSFLFIFSKNFVIL
jgi:hypothetical protein